jgi:predicted small metal-binding protein
MAKVLRCRDVGLDCEGELRADTEEELLRKAAEHAQTAHNMRDMPPDGSPQYGPRSATSSPHRPRAAPL